MTKRHSCPFSVTCCAILLAAAMVPVHATDVLALCDRSGERGLWCLVLDQAPAGGAAGTIEVEDQGTVAMTLRHAGDRFNLLSGRSYLLVFHRGEAGVFNQNFSLRGGNGVAQGFTASVDLSRVSSTAPAPAPASRPVKVRLARRANGETPGADYLASLQNYFHFEYDAYYLAILATHLPMGWGR